MRDVTDLLEITKVSERCPIITVTGYYVMTQHKWQFLGFLGLKLKMAKMTLKIQNIEKIRPLYLVNRGGIY